MQDFTNPPEHYIQYLQPIFELNQDTARSFSGEFPATRSCGKCGSLAEETSPVKFVYTYPGVCHTEVLTPWQSGLTLPKENNRPAF
jgi:hypothetical protein